MAVPDLEKVSAVRRPVAGEVQVHDRRIYVVSGPDAARPDLREAFAGQDAGLCGAAVPGAVLLYTGLYSGDVPLVVEVHDGAPALDEDWEDVVEASFRPASDRTRLVRWDGGASWDLGLIRTDYRVRWCARGMDDAVELPAGTTGKLPVDGYLLQFWPAPPAPARVVRQTSDTAEDMHGYARATPRTPAQQAEAARRTRELFARAAEERAERAAEARRLHYEEWEWGGRLPSERLRDASGSNVLGLLRFDSELVHALDVAGPGVQRAVALLAARRACETAGLTGLPWVAHALAELAEGRPLPPPFDDGTRMREALRADPRVPDTSVRGATPPERPPYVPLPSKDTGHTHVEVVHMAVPAHTPGLISQPHFALPAVLAAADPAPLVAAIDAVWHALNTFGEHCPRFLGEIRSACAERAGKSFAALLRVRTTPPRPADVTAIVPQLAPLARTATRLHPRPGSPSPRDSSVGGPLLWPADEPWPHCDGPHEWDGVNVPVTPEGERRRRLRRAAEANGTPPDAPDGKAAGRTGADPRWPDGPVQRGGQEPTPDGPTARSPCCPWPSCT
ncbi:hypothetical protein ACL02R_03040 [Streptomyces sp. MS19]|uniref:hypothetical protein n=1 Tax=Streptomyces sp. MS19 TaxID=3385972 RepID=UPI0039A22A83